MLKWLAKNAKPVGLTAALVAVASGVYLLLKYASITAAAVYAALLIQLVIAIAIYVVHRWVVAHPERAEAETDENRVDVTQSAAKAQTDMSLPALTLAVRLFAAVVFITIILVIGIGYETQLTLQEIGRAHV